MKLVVSRIAEWQGATIGVLLLSKPKSDKKLCYTLEDGHSTIKIPGQTRIPAGLYELSLRTFGGFHERYSKADWMPHGMHKGMIEVMKVPGFTDILHHVGNIKADTSGCTLYGMDFMKNSGDIWLKSSRIAYKTVYPLIRDAILSGEMVTIEYKDNDR